MKKQFTPEGFIEVPWSCWRARLLSIIIPGSGQLYAGKTFAALVWMPAVVFGYFASITLGLTAHAVCILDAA